MPMLECPGVFIAPLVPDGWTASGQPGTFYELEPPSQDAAIHISVYGRDGRALGEHEARDTLAKFVASALGSTTGQIRALDEGPRQQRAFSQLNKPDDSGELKEWLTACILWPEAMLICSFVANPNHSSLREAERMFASIAPAAREQRSRRP
jgi:hypothetical protein